MAIKYYLMSGALVVAALGGYKVADWQWSEKYSNHLQADAEANYKAIAEVQEKQLKLNQELEHAYQAAKQMQDKHKDDLAAADSAADRLREQINRIKAMPAGGNSSTLRISASAATDRVVFSELLIQSDRMAGDYAAEADRNRIAVLNCSNEYNAVRNASGRHN